MKLIGPEPRHKPRVDVYRLISLTIFAPGLLRGERTQQELSPLGVG